MKKNQTLIPIAACVITLVTAIVYAFAEARENSPVVIGLLIAAAVVEGVLVFKPIPYIEYIPFAMVLASLAIFVRLAFDEIGDIISSVNMNGLSTSWIASTVLLVLSAIVMAVSTVAAAKRS